MVSGGDDDISDSIQLPVILTSFEGNVFVFSACFLLALWLAACKVLLSQEEETAARHTIVVLCDVMGFWSLLLIIKGWHNPTNHFKFMRGTLEASDIKH